MSGRDPVGRVDQGVCRMNLQKTGTILLVMIALAFLMLPVTGGQPADELSPAAGISGPVQGSVHGDMHNRTKNGADDTGYLNGSIRCGSGAPISGSANP